MRSASSSSSTSSSGTPRVPPSSTDTAWVPGAGGGNGGGTPPGGVNNGGGGTWHQPPASSSSGISAPAVDTNGLAALAVAESQVELVWNGRKTLHVTAEWEDGRTQDVTAAVHWITEAADIAVVSTGGVVEARGPGQARLVGALGALSVSVDVEVHPIRLVGLFMEHAQVVMARGTLRRVIAFGHYEDGSVRDLSPECTWISSDGELVEVDAGLVRAVGEGITTVRAEADGFSAETQVTVTAATVHSVSISPGTTTVPLGVHPRFQATAVYSDGSVWDVTAEATWSLTNPDVAQLSDGEPGSVRSVIPGRTQVSASFGGLTAAAVVVVTPAVLVELTMVPDVVTLPVGTRHQVRLQGRYSDGTDQDLRGQATWRSSQPGTLLVHTAPGNEGLVEALAPGTVSVEATVDGHVASATITVSDATLVGLMVSPPTPSAAWGTTVQLRAWGLFSDDSTMELTGHVRWTSQSPEIAVVSPGGLVLTSTPGAALISAELGTAWDAAVLTVTNASLTSVVLSAPSVRLPVGAQQQLGATGRFSDGTHQDISGICVWSMVDPAVATVSNAGHSRGAVAAIAEGTTLVQATLRDITAAVPVQVLPAALERITITPATAAIPSGVTQQYSAQGRFSDGSTQDITERATWASTNTAVATAMQASALGIATGTTTVVALLNGVSASAELQVTPAQLRSLQVTPAHASLPAGGRQQLAALATYSDGSVRELTTTASWVSSDPSVAVVDAGLVRALGSGTATVRAEVDGVEAETVITVTNAVLVELTIDPSTVALGTGRSTQLSAHGVYSDGSTLDLTAQVAWASSSTQVATVSNATGTQGRLMGWSAGTSAITATMDGLVATAALTVSTPTVVGLELSPASVRLAQGTQVNFTATAVFSDGGRQAVTHVATWTTPDPALALVRTSGGTRGQVTALAPGAAVIQVSYGGRTATASLEITNATLTSLEVQGSSEVPAGYKERFTCIGTFSDGTTQDLTAQADWSSTQPSIASVSTGSGQAGLAVGMAVGHTEIDATTLGMTARVAVVVSNATLSSLAVSPSPMEVTVGAVRLLRALGTFSSGATLDLSTQVTWNSSNAAVVSVSNGLGRQGEITAIRPGNAGITATAGNRSAATVITVR